MASGFLNVGISGLTAAQSGLLTAGHNIANASTPGYNRQYTVQTTNTPVFTGAGYLGQGTNVLTIKRVYNEFLQREVRVAETNVAELQTYTEQISRIDNLLADPSAGLSPALQSFFKAAQEAAANPASIPARQAMLSSGQALAARFNSLDQQLTQMRDGVNTQISNEITSINSLVQQVASLNERILVAQAAASSQPPNDLLDQRDQLVSDLNKEIQVSVQTESDGSYSVFFGSGQPLVVGGQTYSLLAQPSPEDLTQMEVALRAPSGQVVSIPESLVSGGVLGGLLKFRSETLDTAQNELGRIAIAMTATVNAQHALGQDIDGDAGGDFFKPMVSAALGAPGNAGTATIGANIVVSDYRVTYDGTNYNVTRLSDNTVFTPSATLPLVVDGIQFSLSAGTPAAGDTFIIKPGALPADRVVKLASASDAVMTTTGSNLQTLTDSDYRLTLSATNTFTFTRLSDDVTWTGKGSSQQAAIDDLMTQIAPQGFALEISAGTAVVGDSFLMRPTRYGARDMALKVTDPRDLALGQGFRTSSSVTNAGTGTISAGKVTRNDVPLSAPVQVTYDAASNSLVGFPVGSTVVVGSTTYNINSSSQRVPYSTGYNMSFNGTGFVLSGSPANGDVLVFNPPATVPTAGNNGLAALFGTPVSAGNAATGSVVPATTTAPLTIVAGANDKFDISVDGGTTTTITLTPGSYTPTALAAMIETQIDAAVGPAGVAVTINGSNQLVVTSDNGGGSVTLTQSNPNLGTGAITSGIATSTRSLPSAPFTLTYHQADTTAGLPARLTGFPAGSTVTVTLANGTTTEYPMNSADGYTDAAAFADYVNFTSGATISVNGMEFAISGAPTDGDTFSVGPNTSGTGDNRNALAIGDLQLANTLANGTATFQSSYSTMVALVGNKAREVEVTLEAQENLVTQGQDAMQSMSGVNLDEEASNIMRFQQAYQAAAKMIELSGKLFDQLVALGG